MSVFTSLRDSLEKGIAGYASGYGLNITPELATSAGGTPTAASPLPVQGRPANTNPAAPTLGNHTLLIVGAVVVVVLLFLFKRR